MDPALLISVWGIICSDNEYPKNGTIGNLLPVLVPFPIVTVCPIPLKEIKKNKKLR
ncbi:hypothetical protein GCM10010976_28810 [Bizionia arctica]|uniref:Uncharacterized protein n=1 Tax=Bizionia arctica TaxID=1495645 RepID=A0A917GT39_9FLAO|nr:hypothetical protein GCM10010976_28810 [Bizionia arctica]